MKKLTFNKFTKLITNPIFIIAWFGFMVISYFFIDRPLAYYMNDSFNRHIVKVAQVITHIGQGGYYLVGLAALAIFAKFIYKNRTLLINATYLLGCVLIAGIICDILKFTLSRPRPTHLFNQHVYGFLFFKTNSSFWSFPSGHTTITATTAVGLCYIFPRYWLGFISLALIVAATRVIITAHYLSDVMGGLYLGAICATYLYRYVAQLKASSSAGTDNDLKRTSS